MIRPIGPASAQVAFILDYPSPKEIETGNAGHGYVEHRLNDWLRDAGSVPYTNCYKTEFIKQKLEGRITSKVINDFKQFLSSQKISFTYYQDLLIEELNSLRDVNVVFLVGEAALLALTGETSIEKYRGTLIEASEPVKEKLRNPFLKMFPIYHPRQIQIEYKRTHYTLADITKALKYKNDPTPYKSDILTWVCRSNNELKNYFDRAQHATHIVNDIETFHNFITANGFSHDGKEGVSIPMLDTKIDSLTLAMMYGKMREFMNDCGLPFYGQNYIYDCFKLHQAGFIDWKKFKFGGCTMDLGKLIYQELPASLAFYNSIYTEMPYFKDEGKEFNPYKTNKDQLYIYNAKDCISTYRVLDGQIKDAKEEKVYDFWQKYSIPYWHFYRKIDNRGIRVDFQRKQQLLDEFDLKFDLAVSALEYDLGAEFNPISPQQCRILFYEEMGMPEKYAIDPATKKRTLRTDETIIEWFILNMSLSPEHEEIFNNVMKARHYKKLISYIKAVAHPDGRLRTHYKPGGTGSGRTSTNYHMDQWYTVLKNDKVMRKKMGLPLQTIPKHGFQLPNKFSDGSQLREMFVPSHGKVFYDYDQMSAEAFYVALLSKDWEFLEKLEMGKEKFDTHKWTGSIALKKPMEEITKWERQEIGKKTRHAGNYGMKAPKLSEIAQISLALATEALKNFHDYSPQIVRIFHREIDELVQRHACIVTELGRKHTFLGKPNDPNVLRSAYSFYPQASVSDYQKNGMIELEETLGEDTTNFLAEFHDGNLGECRPEDLERILTSAKRIMERPRNMLSGSIIRNREFVIPIECSWSDENWGNMKEIKV